MSVTGFNTNLGVQRYDYNSLDNTPATIVNISKTGTSGLVDTYSIEMSDGSAYTFTVKNGQVDESNIRQYIENWLNEHPEATTTVQDGSVTSDKLDEKTRIILDISNSTNYYGDTSISEGSSTFEECFRKVYTEVMDEYGGDVNKIPVIVETDQHGALNANAYSVGVHETINNIVNWADVSRFINLGDAVSRGWIDSSGIQWFSCTELDKMVQTYKPIPFSKQLNVVGNHDAFTWVNGAYGDRRDEQIHLNKYFRNTNNAQKFGNSGCYVVKDEYFNVKYLVLSGYDSVNNNWYFKSEWVDLMIRELSADDGYDIILISHETLNPAYDSRVFPTTQDMIWKVSAENDNHFGLGINLNPIISAKQNKTSGSFSDGQGVVHTYDFSATNTRLLCGLHGHTHYEVYNYIEGKYVGFSMSPYTMGQHWVFFLLVDRAEDCIHVWKMNSQSGAASYTYTKYVIPFDVSQQEEYTIKNRLANTTVYNVSRKIRNGQPYSQYIRPASGKTIGTVSITMGEDDVTSTYYDSSTKLIHIPEVTGNIVLLAYDSTTDPSIIYYYIAANSNGGISSFTGSPGGPNKSYTEGTTLGFWPTLASGYRIDSITATNGSGEPAYFSVNLLSGRVNDFTVNDDYTFTFRTAPIELENGYLNYSNELIPDNRLKTTGYEDTSGYDLIYFTTSYGDNHIIAEYDENKELIRMHKTPHNSLPIFLNENTKYVRHSSLDWPSNQLVMSTYGFQKRNIENYTSFIVTDAVALAAGDYTDIANPSALLAPNATSIEAGSINVTSSLSNVIAPKLENVSTIFKNNTNLDFVDIHGGSAIAASAFFGDYRLTMLILHSPTLVALNNVSAFTNTPFRGYSSRTGILIVPRNLIEQYKTANNWSTIYNEGYMDIWAIEDGWDDAYQFESE